MIQNNEGDTRYVTPTETISGEVAAAIAAALYEVMEEAHDIESNILTFKKITNNYSPWSSKIYGLREPFKR